MNATIQKWGNSLALRIPVTVARQLHVQEGDAVQLKIGNSGLTVKPVPKRPSLDELLAKVTPSNLHEPTDWGAEMGREDVPE